ncbi:transposase [Actomonas aquatica]|uniref:Transposase n=1 Tax=Actomonas aquatica TaxID=2866162 RepID=A0ABZ1C1V1_9BACT|nr:transposase [Opitutus sp. WL0086]WRQ85616.1 transposase [Opitutus sp. WL0086]
MINRGNYRWDVFGSAGAAQRFVETLEEAVQRYEWELGAYVVMRNHYHLAVRTPVPNLSAGMHWLQATFAARFNRLRGENGHLFQGRYKALLLQDEEVWARVADYIHLNPLRAFVVEPAQLGNFRWSSLRRYLSRDSAPGLTANPWLGTLGWNQSRRKDWLRYLDYLKEIHAIEQGKPLRERSNYTRGWAIGATEWKQVVATDNAAAVASKPHAEYTTPQEANHARWRARLGEILKARHRSTADLQATRRAERWKCEVADQLQRETGASLVWLAEQLNIQRSATLRMGLWRMRKM